MSNRGDPFLDGFSKAIKEEDRDRDRMPFKPPQQAQCPVCGKSVYAAEERLAGGNKYHKFCFKCAMCNTMLDSTTCTGHDGGVYCKGCPGKKFGPKGLLHCCHAMCNKMLDSTTCTEHDGGIYCKGCHGKKFGPKGYGFGQGAGALSTETGAQFGNTEGEMGSRPQDAHVGGAIGGPNACGRCARTVYAMEKATGMSDPWHKACCTCKLCKKKLDPSSLQRHEKEIYCKGCYAKNYGATGYGFGIGAGCLSTGT